MRTVYTGGTFDLFHAGHVEFLRRARALGDRLVVGLNTDEFVREFKRQTVCTLMERKIVLQACIWVDEVVINVGGSDSSISIAFVRPDIIAIGDDWKDRDYLGQLGITQDWLDEMGIVIEYLPYTKGVSTTEIIQRAMKSEFDRRVQA